MPILDQQVKSWPFKFCDDFCSNQLRVQYELEEISNKLWMLDIFGIDTQHNVMDTLVHMENISLAETWICIWVLPPISDTSKFKLCALQMFSRKLWLAQLLLQLWSSFKAHNFAWKIILMRFITNDTLSHHQWPGFFNSKMFFRPQANNQKIHMKKI